MFFSKMSIQLQITIKYEHMNIENIRFILYSRACGENSRMRVYFYCNCCNTLRFAMSGLHFVKKSKVFAIGGFTFGIFTPLQIDYQ